MCNGGSVPENRYQELERALVMCLGPWNLNGATEWTNSPRDKKSSNCKAVNDGEDLNQTGQVGDLCKPWFLAGERDSWRLENTSPRIPSFGIVVAACRLLNSSAILTQQFRPHSIRCSRSTRDSSTTGSQGHPFRSVEVPSALKAILDETKRQRPLFPRTMKMTRASRQTFVNDPRG
jgi:hypothetical protein